MQTPEMYWQEVARKRMRLLWLGLTLGLIIGVIWGWSVGYNDGLLLGGA